MFQLGDAFSVLQHQFVVVEHKNLDGEFLAMLEKTNWTDKYFLALLVCKILIDVPNLLVISCEKLWKTEDIRVVFIKKAQEQWGKSSTKVIK